MSKTILARYNEVEKLNKIDVPWEAWTMFGEQCKKITIASDAICLGEDYKTVEDLRKGLSWYVEQLGGVAVWGPTNDKT